MKNRSGRAPGARQPDAGARREARAAGTRRRHAVSGPRAGAHAVGGGETPRARPRRAPGRGDRPRSGHQRGRASARWAGTRRPSGRLGDPQAGVVSFKVSRSFLEAMKGVPNRSEFIRAAVLTALDSACPLCKGTGILTPNQKRHWQTFARDHSLQECQDCHELRLICEPRRVGPTASGATGT